MTKPLILPIEQLEALRQLRSVYPAARIAMIGATALSFHIPLTWRHTADLDLVLAISAGDLDTSLSRLTGWKRDPKMEQRWTAPNGALLDLVPAPDDALQARTLVWPKTRLEMSLAGIGLALQAEQVEIESGLHVAIPAVPVIALLKMAAYVDRPHERQRIFRDLAHIIRDYPSDDDDKHFTDEVRATNLDVRTAKGYILGTELRELAAGLDRKIVEQFLEKAVDGDGWGTFVRSSPWPGAEEKLLACMQAFQSGFAPKVHADSNVASAARFIPITFVINGDAFETQIAPSQPLIVAVESALKETRNTGRKAEDWELRFESGERITDLTKTAEQYHLIPGTTLYLNLKTGAGGNAPRPGA